MGNQKGRKAKQQKSREKKFNKLAAHGKNGAKKKDKYAHFKGKHALKNNTPDALEP